MVPSTVTDVKAKSIQRAVTRYILIILKLFMNKDAPYFISIRYRTECLFSEDFLNTKVLNLGTSNVIMHIFIRTGVQKCQPFLTYTAPVFTMDKTQTQAK